MLKTSKLKLARDEILRLAESLKVFEGDDVDQTGCSKPGDALH